MAEGYNGIKRKVRRVTEIKEIDVADEYRRAYGVYNLIKCMQKKPEQGKSYHIITGGAVDLIAHLMWMQIHWQKMKRVFISAWAISGTDILLLEKWHNEGIVRGVEVLVGDIFQSKYTMEWNKLMEMRDAGVVESVYKSTIHSKLILMEAEDGTKIVVESSANCNMNPRVEQSCVTVSGELFDFYWSYLHDLFEEEDARICVREIAEEDLSNEKAEFDSVEGTTLFG